MPYFNAPVTFEEGVGLMAHGVPISDIGGGGGAATQVGVGGFDFFSPTKLVAPTFTNITNSTSHAYAFIEVDGEQWLEVTWTSTAAQGGMHIAFNTPLTYGVPADSLTLEFVQVSGSRGNISAFVGVDAGYSVNTNTGNRTLGFPGNDSDPISLDGLTSVTWHRDRMEAAKTGFTTECLSTPFVVGKIAVQGGGAAGPCRFLLRRFVVGGHARKARLAIVADDGYKSWLYRGVPILERYGIKSTMACIQASIVSAGLSNTEAAGLEELKRFVASGNTCIAHGTNNGSTNLYTAPFGGTASAADNAMRVEDMLLSSRYLVDNGLTDAAGGKCYVWPQGRWNAATGETSLLDAAYDAGFRLCRAAQSKPTPSVISYTGNPCVFNDIRALAPNNRMRMVLPVIGHNYALSAQAERFNISQLCNNVLPQLAASGMDAVFMFHRVETTPSLGLHISPEALEEIAQTIESFSDQIDNVLFQELI